MKKILAVMFVAVCIAANSYAYEFVAINQTSAVGTAVILNESGDDFVDAVTAVDSYGRSSCNFKIFQINMANGKKRFYATKYNSSKELTIQMLENNNNYRFYVTDENGVRWYFNNRTLELKWVMHGVDRNPYI